MSVPIFLKIPESWVWVFLVVLALQIYSTEELPWLSFRRSGNFSTPQSGRKINLYPEIVKDQIKRKICKYIKSGCEGIYGQKKNDTTSEIIFTPMKPPDFTKTDVKDVKHTTVKPTPVFSSPADSTKDPKCMKFIIPDEYFGDGIDIQGADIYIYFRVKTRRKKSRRIVLKVYSLHNGTKQKKNVAKLQVRPNDTAWYKVSLPRSVTKNVENTRNRTLSMCIACKRCNSRTKITFPLKTRSSRRKRKRNKKKNKRKNRDNRKERHTKKKKARRGKKPKKLQFHRPFLIYRLKQNHRLKRDLNCLSVNDTQHCCKYEQFVSFSDLGFEQDILFPAGVTYTSCIGGCGSSMDPVSQRPHIPQIRRLASPEHVCQATSSEETNTFIVLRDRIGILTMKNGNVLQCGCRV